MAEPNTLAYWYARAVYASYTLEWHEQRNRPDGSMPSWPQDRTDTWVDGMAEDVGGLDLTGTGNGAKEELEGMLLEASTQLRAIDGYGGT